MNFIEFEAIKPVTTSVNGTLPPPTFVPTNTYIGYTRTYSCSSSSFNYVFKWRVDFSSIYAPVTMYNGILNIGTFSQSSASHIDSVHTFSRLGMVISYSYYVSYTINGVPNNTNYCNTTMMQNLISYTFYRQPNRLTGDPGMTISSGGNATENISPSSYVIYQLYPASFYATGAGHFNLYVAPGVTTCGPCHGGTLGYSPTIYFYYRLAGTGAYTSVAHTGTDLNGFYVALNAPGTYEYFTQGYDTPGVLSGPMYAGTILIQ